jgi:hypothetical protein
VVQRRRAGQLKFPIAEKSNLLVVFTIHHHNV